MSGRDAIFSDLRKALGRDRPLNEAERAALRDRASATPRSALPHIDGDPIERFMNRVTAAGASATRVRDTSDVAGAVVEFLDAHDLPRSLVTSGDEVLASVQWPQELQVEQRGTRGDDPTSVTGALAALAETGSVVLKSGETNAHDAEFSAGQSYCDSGNRPD